MSEPTDELDPDLYPPLDEPSASGAQPIVLEPVLGDDQILDYVQQQRQALVKDITKKGMPQDNGERNLMLAALRDMSHDVLTKKRIGTEKQASQEQTRAIVAAILTAATPRTGRLETDGIASGTIPTLDVSRLDPLDVVPDETRQGEIHDNFESFQERMAQKHAE